MEERKDFNIVRCDEERPYIFISYSSADRDIVWRDVEELQQRGYNIWIDRENLQAGKTWDEKALEAISRLSCKCLIFYLSGNSLRSQPCLEELRQTRAELTKMRHRGTDLDFIPVDVEPINDLVSYVNDIYDGIEEDETKKLSDKERDAETVSAIMHEFFQNNNAVDRILSMDDPRRGKDYYEEIIKALPEKTCLMGDQQMPLQQGFMQQDPIDPVTDGYAEDQQPAKKSMDLKIIIGIAAAAFVILMAIVVGVSLSNGKDNNDRSRGSIAQNDDGDDDGDEDIPEDPTPAVEDTEEPAAEPSPEDISEPTPTPAPTPTPEPENAADIIMPGYVLYGISAEVIGKDRGGAQTWIDTYIGNGNTIGEQLPGELMPDGTGYTSYAYVSLDQNYEIQVLSDEFYVFDMLTIDFGPDGKVIGISFDSHQKDTADFEDIMKETKREFGRPADILDLEDEISKTEGLTWYSDQYRINAGYYSELNSEYRIQWISVKLKEAP